jgi:hypothetical protein
MLAISIISTAGAWWAGGKPFAGAIFSLTAIFALWHASLAAIGSN